MGHIINKKLKKFVTMYLVTEDAIEAAQSAGYTADMGTKLLEREDVQEALAARKGVLEGRESADVTREALARECDEAYALARLYVQPAAMVAAIALKAKLYGLDVSKLQLSGDVGLAKLFDADIQLMR